MKPQKFNMESLTILFIESIIIAFMIVVMHASIRHFGIGPLFIFLGSIQFFQTILAGNVYNIYFNEFVFAPGSTLLYTSTLILCTINFPY